jgi:hypothetical protein
MKPFWLCLYYLVSVFPQKGWGALPTPRMLRLSEIELGTVEAAHPKPVKRVNLVSPNFVRRRGQQTLVVITPAQHNLIQLLMDVKLPLTTDEISVRLSGMGTPESDIKHLVDDLNSNANRDIQMNVVVALADGTYSLDRDPRDMSGAELSFPPSGTRVVYRGRSLYLSNKQMAFLKTVAADPNEATAYSALKEVMGWTTEMTVRRCRDHVNGINERTVLATGRPLLRIMRPVGPELDLSPIEQWEPVHAVSTRFGDLSLSGQGERVVSILGKLYNENFLAVSVDDLAETGLSEPEFLKAAAEINLAVGEPFPIFTVTILLSHERRYVFNSETRAFARPPRGRSLDCDSLLEE